MSPLIGLLFASLPILFGGLSVYLLTQAQPARVAPDEGVPAVARILAYEETGIRVNKRPLVRFDLEVRGRRVRSETYVSFMQVPAYQPGCLLDVRVDRVDPDKVAIVGPAQGGPSIDTTRA